MSEKSLFVVTLKGRPSPIAIKADSMGYYGDGLYFKSDGETVASVPDVELVARADSIGPASSLVAGMLCEPPRAVPVPPAMQYAELGLAELEPYTATPFWPVLVCFVGGLVIGAALGACAVLLS